MKIPYKKGDLITEIGGHKYYYAGEDPEMKWGTEPCHFLAADKINKYTIFRVTPNPGNWLNVCKKHYNSNVEWGIW